MVIQPTIGHSTTGQTKVQTDLQNQVIAGTFRCWLGLGFMGFSSSGVCYLAFGNQQGELEKDFQTRFKLPFDCPIHDFSVADSAAIPLDLGGKEDSPKNTSQDISLNCFPSTAHPLLTSLAGQRWYRQVRRVIDLYLSPNGISSVSENLIRSIPLDFSGTQFQQQVWQTLISISWGSTISYRQLAEQIGRPSAIRAVAAACAANPIAILIPCHRVIGSNQSMTGYRWGIERKKRLLTQEVK